LVPLKSLSDDGLLENLANKKALIVVSSGGHLLEALLLVKQLGLSKQSLFVTNSNPQSVSLLKTHRHHMIKQVRSRDFVGALCLMPDLVSICSSDNFDCIISTGAAVAISALPAHYLLRIPFYFFESLTRVHSPSLSGKILEFFPSVFKFTSSNVNFNQRWRSFPSILGKYVVEQKQSDPSNLKILVTLGTIPNFRFDRLIDQVVPILNTGDQVFWQVGCTSRNDLKGTTVETISNSQLIEVAQDCHVVITHCGVGTILDLISNGIRPVVIPRLAKFEEHVDDHQIEALAAFSLQNLVQKVDGELTRKMLLEASQKYISRDEIKNTDL
jgi:UDP-N-acetylglucosamine--N-acetylmuramyl-(pentapeptide) pyrophosphoryl-undecaprenol N-acetylglucosamine transferase